MRHSTLPAVSLCWLSHFHAAVLSVVMLNVVGMSVVAPMDGHLKKFSIPLTLPPAGATALSLRHTHTHTHTPHTLSLSLSPHSLSLSRHCFYDWKLVCIEMFSWTLCFKFSSLTRSLSLFLFPFLATWFSFYLFSLPHFKKLRRTIFFWKEIDFKFGLN